MANGIPGGPRRHPLPQVGDCFGELTITGFIHGPRGGVRKIVCQCSCGTESRVDFNNLRAGRTTRCNRCARRAAAFTHSYLKSFGLHMEDDRLRAIWSNRHAAMLARCHDPACRSNPSYGGRGISVVPEWHDRRRFLRDIQLLPGWDNPGLELDRVDNDGPYCLSNCRMATRSQQNGNKRTSLMVEYGGQRMCATDFHRQHCPRYRSTSTVSRKLRAGKTPDQIIREQVRCRGAYLRHRERRSEASLHHSDRARAASRP
jgi:hypothetical protein